MPMVTYTFCHRCRTNCKVHKFHTIYKACIYKPIILANVSARISDYIKAYPDEIGCVTWRCVTCQLTLWLQYFKTTSLIGHGRPGILTETLPKGSDYNRQRSLLCCLRSFRSKIFPLPHLSVRTIGKVLKILYIK